MRWLISLPIVAFLAVVHAVSSSGKRALVVVEELAEKEKYSNFLKDLRTREFEITYDTPKGEKLSLFQHGERAYDHVLLFPGKAKGLGPELTPHKILEFANKGGNLLLALSATHPAPTSIASLLLELDIHLPSDRNSLVVDHFNFDQSSAAERHDVLLLSHPKSVRTSVQNYFSGNGIIALPRTIGHTLGNTNPLLTPILTASSTAYSYNPKDEVETVEDPFATGGQLALVSAMQARNSARLTVLGSAEMLENIWFDAKVKHDGKITKTSNRHFAKQLSAWAFKELGVLRVGRLQHYADEKNSGSVAIGYNVTADNGPEQNPSIYRIKSDVAYTIELSEWSETHWMPYVPPSGDRLQLEFSMLSPFHRLNLDQVGMTVNSTIFGTRFTTPDQHGIFNFRVNYKRPFLTNIDEKRQVTVRHFAHDEWPRSYAISGAWVWIGGIWVTVFGWIAFVGLWLYSAPTVKVDKKAQ